MITILSKYVHMSSYLSYCGGIEYFPEESMSTDVHSNVRLRLLSELREELWVGHCHILGHEVSNSVNGGRFSII